MEHTEQLIPESSPKPDSIEVGVVNEANEEVVVAVRSLVAELASVNQVEITHEWVEKIVNSDSSILLAAKDAEGIFRGFAVLVIFPTIVNPRALVETLVTDPNYRRKGVAEELIKTALQKAAENKVNTVRVSTGKDNISSNALFVKLGGVLEEEYNWYDFEISQGPQ